MWFLPEAGGALWVGSTRRWSDSQQGVCLPYLLLEPRMGRWGRWGMSWTHRERWRMWFLLNLEVVNHKNGEGPGSVWEMVCANVRPGWAWVRGQSRQGKKDKDATVPESCPKLLSRGVAGDKGSGWNSPRCSNEAPTYTQA